MIKIIQWRVLTWNPSSRTSPSLKRSTSLLWYPFWSCPTVWHYLDKAVFYNRTSTCCPPSVVATCTTRASTAGWCPSKPNLCSTTLFSWCIMTSSAMRRSRNWRSCLKIACRPQKFIPSSPTRKWNLWPGLVKRKLFSLNLLQYFYILIIILPMHDKLFFLQKRSDMIELQKRRVQSF